MSGTITNLQVVAATKDIGTGLSSLVHFANDIKMVMLASIPEFSTMCMNAMEAFESINTCKGAVFDSLVCNIPIHDSRDEEGVEVAADFDGTRACEEKQEELVM